MVKNYFLHANITNLIPIKIQNNVGIMRINTCIIHIVVNYIDTKNVTIFKSHTTEGFFNKKKNKR